MKIGPKYKICRRLGPGVFEKCQTQKFTLSEAKSVRPTGRKHGGGGARSDYGIQHREKQRVRLTYGITERQFSSLVSAAVARRGTASTVQLYANLETRLDNIVYRMGLATTRRQARQMVAHGHILVNGVRIMVPSHHARVSDEISIREGSRKKTLFIGLDEQLKNTSTPSWLSMNTEKRSAVVKGVPTPGQAETMFDLGSVIEFYSR